jgi:hypothetical protein
LDRAGQQPGRVHPRGYPEPARAGPAPAGGRRDLEPGGDQRLLGVPKLCVVVLPGGLEHGDAGRPAEPPAGRAGDPAGHAGGGAGSEPGWPASHGGG